MSNPIPPISDEHLVAYLDGELEPVARDRVESLLATDKELRLRLARFEQSWNLLDRLPTATVGDGFAATTVTMIAEELRHSPKTPRWKLWTIGVAAGFLLAAIPMRWIQHRKIRDLPVIQNLELYRVADSVQFLQMLEEEGLFVEDVDDVL